jgi:uncharacterized membrane protein (UPF0127 family)
LPRDQGELFVFTNVNGGQEISLSFWMEDTPIALSVAFIGRDGSLHEIQDMAADSMTLHTPSLPYLYAVETNRGWFANHGVRAGSAVDLSPALSLLTGP